MKKILIFLLLSSVFVFANVGKITATKGEVFVERDSKNENVTIGFILLLNDKIVTKGNSKALVLFNDNTSITIGKDSELSVNDFAVDEAAPGNSKANFGFGNGIFRTITGKIGKLNPKGFKIKTKSASIGIRGSTSTANVEDANVKLTVTDGGYDIQPIGADGLPTGDSVPVDAGSTANISGNDIQVAPSTPADLEADADMADGGDFESTLEPEQDNTQEEENQEEEEQTNEEENQEEEQTNEEENQEEEQTNEEENQEEEQTNEEENQEEEQTNEEEQQQEENQEEQQQEEDQQNNEEEQQQEETQEDQQQNNEEDQQQEENQDQQDNQQQEEEQQQDNQDNQQDEQQNEEAGTQEGDQQQEDQGGDEQTTGDDQQSDQNQEDQGGTEQQSEQQQDEQQADQTQEDQGGTEQQQADQNQEQQDEQPTTNDQQQQEQQDDTGGDNIASDDQGGQTDTQADDTAGSDTPENNEQAPEQNQDQGSANQETTAQGSDDTAPGQQDTGTTEQTSDTGSQPVQNNQDTGATSEVSTDQADTGVPSEDTTIDQDQPQVETQNDVEVQSTNTDAPDTSTPTTDTPQTDSPQVDADTPNVDTDTPNVDTDTPDVDTDAPNIDTDTPEVNTDTPNIDTDTPEVNTDTPNIDTDTPEINTDTPEINTDTPEINTDTPVVNTDTPVINTDTPSIDTDIPEIDTNIPTIDTTSILNTVNDATSAADEASADADEAVTNDPPVVSNTDISSTEDQDTTFTVSATDPDADTVTYSIAEQPSNGTATIDPNTGEVTYTPNPNFNGTETMVVNASDGNNAPVAHDISFEVASVNDNPTAEFRNPSNEVTDTITTDEDTTANLNYNIGDVDGDTVTVTSSAENGSVVINEDGTLSYTPNTAHVGSDTITIVLTDPNGGETTETIDVTVNDVNNDVVASSNAVDSTGAQSVLSDSDLSSATKDIVGSDTYFEYGYLTDENGKISAYITGTLTPSSIINQYITNAQSASYSGGVAALVNGVKSGGNINLDMNFGTKNITGTINVTNGNWNATINNGNIHAYGFNSSNIGGTTDAGAITSGSLDGKFYGTQAQGAGGTFSLDDSAGNSASGSFGATKQ